MSLKRYIFLMLFGTLACCLALQAVIYFFDPTSGGVMALFFFYLSLFLSLLGAFSILGLFFRLIFTHDHLVFKKVTASFRQGVWFSLLVVISLFLKHLEIFAWWNLALLILALALLELFFLSYKVKPSLKI
ncbi:MAG: hypothetical protein PHC97_03670 [Patescibacteria group bacterium]|nr:hypothetical protein [Patescibacteria group bacterium]